MGSTPENPGKNWFKNFDYNEGENSLGDVQNILLVAVALIAAVTFQAGVSPPGGVWQDDENGHIAGRAIYASQKEAFFIFLISNTLALSTSTLILVYLTLRLPFRFEVWVAIASMMSTYVSAVFAVTPEESTSFRYVLLAAVVPFAVRCLIWVFNKLRRGQNGFK
ncbi:uncharacterized protein LOC131166597 [Malania oleifera]|uniref:uncharacterized protein LOC131166597 n=1 Tax=Malania oleifera TaxID=397392 RepID=UPI0025ADD3A6|nr:uncharacterized protein LOC131166597 [Malania oleifera]